MGMNTKKILNKDDINTWLVYTVQLPGSPPMNVQIRYIPSEFKIVDYSVDYFDGKKFNLEEVILRDMEEFIRPLYVEIISHVNGNKVFMNKAFDDTWKDLATFRFAESLR